MVYEKAQQLNPEEFKRLVDITQLLFKEIAE